MKTDYDSLIEGIFERHPSVQVSGFGPRSYKAGIEAMEQFDSLLGSPWKGYGCLHVAGTNGKGTVCSMLATALSRKGYKVGLYTSPHLLDFRERIKIVSDGSWRMIGREDVMEFLQDEKRSEAMEGLSFFEITTGMALWYFGRQKVDYAVVEVGLGGRLDSTNIITPLVSVVTSIGLDHCALLGSTRAEIAAEKAGIFKKGVPAVVWGRDEETFGVFVETARSRGAELVVAEGWGECGGYEPRIEMDARTALCALNSIGIEAGVGDIRDYACATGLQARWDLRRIGGYEAILDMGHNAQALEGNFRRLAGLGRPLVVVFGIMADKDLEGIAPLFVAGAKYFLCAPPTPRALPSGELFLRLSALRPDLDLVDAGGVQEAVRRAVGECDRLAGRDGRAVGAGPVGGAVGAEAAGAWAVGGAVGAEAVGAGPVVYIGGSTFVVAEVLKEL